MSPTPRALTIGRRTYRVAVPEAEAQHLTALAARVDAILTEVLAADANLERDHALVLTCLQLAAQLAEAHQQLDTQATAVTRFHRQLTQRLTQLIPPTA